MDAALTLASLPTAMVPPAVLLNAGAVPAEGEVEGDFSVALARSLVVTMEAMPVVSFSPSPVIATPIAGPMAPALCISATITAGSPVLIAVPIPEPPSLPVAMPKARAMATEPSTEEQEVEERDAEPVHAPLLPSAIPGPANPSVTIGRRADSLPDDEGAEASPTLPGLATPPPALPLAPSPPETPVAISSGVVKAAISSAGSMVLLDASPVSEAAEPMASRPDALGLSQPAPAEVHAAAPERPMPPEPWPAQTSLTAVLPELTSLHAMPRVDFLEATAPAAQSPSAPARQVSSVAVALAFAPGVSNGFRLSLDPAELGRVEIHVQREGDSHSVRVTVERPETLALLQRDRQELDRGLAEAGLRVDSTGIDFSLDTPAGGGSGSGREPGTGQRGHPGGGARFLSPEREMPPPRVLRSLLDLNI